MGWPTVWSLLPCHSSLPCQIAAGTAAFHATAARARSCRSSLAPPQACPFIRTEHSFVPILLVTGNSTVPLLSRSTVTPVTTPPNCRSATSTPRGGSRPVRHRGSCSRLSDALRAHATCRGRCRQLFARMSYLPSPSCSSCSPCSLRRLCRSLSSASIARAAAPVELQFAASLSARCTTLNLFRLVVLSRPPSSTGEYPPLPPPLSFSWCTTLLGVECRHRQQPCYL
jgi:hypothetical protein